MKRNLVIIIVAILIILLFAQDNIRDQFGFGREADEETSSSEGGDSEELSTNRILLRDSFINETIYRWDETMLNMVVVEDIKDFPIQLANYTDTQNSLSKPIEVDWNVLMDIKYRLKYIDEIGAEMYSPIFSEAVEALHEKEIIIEGFVIPFDEEGEILSLSMNPFASCFFCGKASPASIISMYLKDKGKRYKMDDFKRFRGTLFLNFDDPNEFYYILRDAEEG